MTELGVLMDSCEAKNQGAQYPVSEVVTSVQWVAPLLAYPGSPMSAVLGSAAFPVLAGGAEEEGVSSFLEIAVAGDSDIRGAETWRISLSGTQIGASASCGKTQAYLLSCYYCHCSYRGSSKRCNTTSFYMLFLSGLAKSFKN